MCKNSTSTEQKQFSKASSSQAPHTAVAGRGEREARSALGKNTKSAATSRTYQYRLRSVAQGLLRQKHRVQTCQKVPSHGVQLGIAEITISKNENGRAYWSGLGACGDVHSCPVCREKIGNVRANEVRQVMAGHRKEGGKCFLVTKTLSHKRSTKLVDSLDKITAATRRFNSWRKVKDLKAELGYTNLIRSTEVTFGKNGWHPHFHEVWLVNNELSIKRIEQISNELSEQWQIALRKVGGNASRKRGFDLRYRDDEGVEAAGAYITKWAYELTHMHKKDAHNGSITPFKILDKLLDQANFDVVLANRYREYSDAMFKRPMMYFGRGLKDKYLIEEVSDEEVANRPEQEHVITVTSEQHRAIRYYNYEGLALDIAEQHGYQILSIFIQSVHQKYLDQERSYRDYKKNVKNAITASTIQTLDDMDLI